MLYCFWRTLLSGFRQIQDMDDSMANAHADLIDDKLVSLELVMGFLSSILCELSPMGKRSERPSLTEK